MQTCRLCTQGRHAGRAPREDMQAVLQSRASHMHLRPTCAHQHQLPKRTTLPCRVDRCQGGGADHGAARRSTGEAGRPTTRDAGQAPGAPGGPAHTCRPVQHSQPQRRRWALPGLRLAVAAAANAVLRSTSWDRSDTGSASRAVESGLHTLWCILRLWVACCACCRMRSQQIWAGGSTAFAMN